MATKHVIVCAPGALSPQQLAQIEADYERDLADEPKRKLREPDPETAEQAGDGEGEAEK